MCLRKEVAATSIDRFLLRDCKAAFADVLDIDGDTPSFPVEKLQREVESKMLLISF